MMIEIVSQFALVLYVKGNEDLLFESHNAFCVLKCGSIYIKEDMQVENS